MSGPIREAEGAPHLFAHFQKSSLFNSLHPVVARHASHVLETLHERLVDGEGLAMAEWTPEAVCDATNTILTDPPAGLPSRPAIVFPPIIAFHIHADDQGWFPEAGKIANTVFELAEASPRRRAPGRNDPCPCERGRVTKACCGRDVWRSPIGPNPMLRQSIMTVVRNQIDEGKPLETKAAFARLLATGLSEPEACARISSVLAPFLVATLVGREFDAEGYSEALRTFAEHAEVNSQSGDRT